jgi:hypothetical protein
MEELYIDPIQQRKKNNLAIHNEHILKKHFPDLWKFARLSNIRLDIEEALNSEVPEFILNN